MIFACDVLIAKCDVFGIKLLVVVLLLMTSVVAHLALYPDNNK